MNPESVERIVIAEPAFDFVTEEPGNQTGSYAYSHGSFRCDKAARRGNHYQTGYCARAKTKHTRLAPCDPFCHRPDERGHRGCESRRRERVGGDDVRSYSAARIESVPTDPQHAGADHAQHHAVRRHRLLAEADAFAQDQAED